MAQQVIDSQEDLQAELDRIIESLERLGRFIGPPNEFWPAFLEGASRLVRAKFGALMIQDDDEHSWKNLCVWPVVGASREKVSKLKSRMERKSIPSCVGLRT